jgi:predicted GTPase
MAVAPARKVVVMGAGGRDFHNFNVVFREDPGCEVVAFTAAQIPGIEGRRYPASLAGPRYPNGIPIWPESRLGDLIDGEWVDEVVLSYSDLSHEEVMHKASAVLAGGADFRLLGPKATMLRSKKPVVAVCAVRTGCGKSQTVRRIGEILLEAGLRVVLVRHPMPYGDLERMRVQRFASLADIDEADPTIEEREEYEVPVGLGLVVYAGVDYGEILRLAEAEADVILWDGGNNDFPFFEPRLLITVVDPLRAGDELTYYPGETTLRMADVVIVNKIDSATPQDVQRVLADVEAVNPSARVVFAESPVMLEDGPSLRGKRALVVEDGPTLTHGGMAFGAGTVAARNAGATLVDVLPALGYSSQQLHELEQTINACACDVVVTGTPIDLARLIRSRHPIRRATYELREMGGSALEEILEPLVAEIHGRQLLYAL